MKVHRALHVALVLASFIVFPLTASAMRDTGNMAQPEAKRFRPGVPELQRITGCSFQAGDGGMKITAILDQRGALPAVGFEKDDTVLSIDWSNTTDIDSLISAVINARGRTVFVVFRDWRNGNIGTVSVSF